MSLHVENFVMEESSSCYSCGHVTSEGAAGACPKCGRRLRTATQVRRLGWLQLAIGVFLVGLMGTITYNLAPSLLPSAAATRGGARFTGTPEQAQLILGLFGMVLVFGLGSMLSGLWQIKTGRRNKWLFVIMVLLFVVLILFSWFLRSALRGAS